MPDSYVEWVKHLVPRSFPFRPQLKKVYHALKTEEAVPPSRADDFHRRYFAHQAIDTTQPVLDARAMPSSGPFAWLDHPDALVQVNERLANGLITEEQAEYCRAFVRDGYVILPRAIPADVLDRVWAKYSEGVAAGRVASSGEKKTADDPHHGHVMNAHLIVPEIYDAFAHPKVMETANLLLGREMVPFQTLMFPKGREQLAHSDSIHMTTYPLGYMCASWIAFEDIHPDSGPLFYYPGSHRLPYVFARDVGIDPVEFRTRQYALVAERYEPYIQRVLDSSGLERKTFLAKKGDVLFWHANLIHGGSMRKDIRPSRRSMACHYFAKGAFCYHDLAGAPADRLDQGTYA
ncbi:MAG: phytanoyl-CoA dioxygenase family protein [Archangiaceae bacterium]|nr:phytanoyl-CoA dioxygenase family protein [Archangiaceae bacterium]